MSKTGHKNILMPDGQLLTRWIQPTMRDEGRRYGVEMPTEKQIALVISALRMHTVMEHAGLYDRSELGKPDEITEYWPIESSIGCYFRDAAESILREEL